MAVKSLVMMKQAQITRAPFLRVSPRKFCKRSSYSCILIPACKELFSSSASYWPEEIICLSSISQEVILKNSKKVKILPFSKRRCALMGIESAQ
jgi:hypothetical protein